MLEELEALVKKYKGSQDNLELGLCACVSVIIGSVHGGQFEEVYDTLIQLCLYLRSVNLDKIRQK